MDTIVNFAENLHEADQMSSLWHSRKSTVALVMGTRYISSFVFFSSFLLFF